jgi:hypothetical protein
MTPGRAGSVFALLRKKGQACGVLEPKPGAVVFVQRFDSALRLNLHFHALVLDGTFDGSDPKLGGFSLHAWVRLVGGADAESLPNDVLVCGNCGGRRRVLTFLTDPPVVHGSGVRGVAGDPARRGSRQQGISTTFVEPARAFAWIVRAPGLAHRTSLAHAYWTRLGGRERSDNNATNSADPAIDQTMGIPIPPTWITSRSGRPSCRDSQAPSRAPMNPSTMDTRHPPRE